jgi:hypothetical protein
MVDLAIAPSFGGTDADQDPILLECFEDHPSFLRLKDHSAYCILGRKGSGKTAIFKRMLTERRPDWFSFGHTFSDYPWAYHDKQKSVGVPEDECYVPSWRFLCLITLAKILLNRDGSQPHDEFAFVKLGAIERFILDSYGTRDPDVTQVFNPNTQLRFSYSAGIDWKLIKAGVKADSVPMEDLPIFFNEVNLNLKEAIIGSLNPAHSYYVLFDQLDLGLSYVDSNYSRRLIGLMLAAKDLNDYAKLQGKRLSVGIFLRDDIYAQLRFEDKNKITENACAFVHWDRKDSGITLKALMERRFRHVFADETITWDNVFDEARQMTGRQSKYNYIRDRTFLRPRDMIKFCNEVLIHYKHTAHEEKFENANVIGAQVDYSDYLLRELEDEIHKQLPKSDVYLDILRRLDSLQFSRGEFDKLVLEESKNLPNETATSILKALFDFSVISYLAPGGGGGGAEYVWKYRDPRMQFRDAAVQFRVHPGFKEALNLKRFVRDRGRPVNATADEIEEILIGQKHG